MRRPRMPSILPVTFLVAAGAWNPVTAVETDPPAPQEAPLVLGLPVRVSTLPGTMKLPVIEAALIDDDEWLVVLGGMKKDFTASPAIQLRTPQGTWRPVGAQMKEARINPSAIALENGRVFVWGGYGGSARKDLVQRIDGELLQPKVAGSAQLITPPSGSDWSDASNPVRLPEGSVGMVVKDQLQRFDAGDAGRWVSPIPLGRSLQGPTLARLEDGRLLACGTSEAGTDYLVIEIDPSNETATLWKEPLGVPALGGRLHHLPDGRLMLLGWTRLGSALESGSLILDPASRSAEVGPNLPTDTNALTWMSSHTVDAGVLVLGTEVTPPAGAGDSPTAPKPVSYLLRMEGSGGLRAWSLNKLPPRRRPMARPAGKRTVELIGGYRFGAGGAAMENTSVLVNYGTGLVGD